MSDGTGRKTSALDRAASRWGERPDVFSVQQYRRSIERPVQEAAAQMVGLRPRGTPRPTMRVYKVACGEKDPLRVAKAFLEDVMFVRDHVPEGRLPEYDARAFEVVEELAQFTSDAILASDRRRAGETPGRRA